MILKKPLVCLLVLFLVALTTPTWANVYASGLNKTAERSFSYILNENADTGVQLQVWQVGGGMVYSENVGAQAKGVQNWTWYGSGGVIGNSYKLKVIAADDGHAAWSQISADATPTSFYVPVGVSVYTSQNSASFGKIYVSNAAAGTTGFGRACSDGIYMLNADSSAASFTTGGITWTGGSSPWKSTVGPDGHVYVSDLSNDLVYEFSSDMTSATRLIDASNRTANQWVGGVLVSGTGANRKLYLPDTNYNDNARKGLIEYNIGTNATVAPGDTGTQVIGPTYFTFYPYDVARDSAGDWYMCQFRWDPAQAPAISKFDDSLPWPINIALWETAKVAPYNGASCIDLFEPKGWVAYGNYYTGEVQIFNMADGSYVGGFDAGSRMRDIAFDAAGNIVTVDNIAEWAKVWSPGDNANSFTTESYFTFVVPEPSSLLALLVGLPGLLVLRRRKH